MSNNPSAKKSLVLSVDDSEMNHKIIGKMLSDEYQQVSVLSGSECLVQMKKEVPDLILLDVTMPGMDGYETCTEIRKDPKCQYVPVLFLSGRCSIEEKLRGYEVGGDDYITKPFDANELLAKIQKAIKTKAGMEQLTDKVNIASSIAFNALKDNGNITLCLNFFKEVFNYHTIDGLVQHFLGAAQDMGLSVTLQVKIGQKLFYYSGDGVERELEQALLAKVSGGHELVVLGRRVVLNSGSLSLLIKNLPVSQEHIKTSIALQDYMLTLLKGVQFRLEEILAHAKLQHQRDRLVMSMSDAAGSLKASEKQFSSLLESSHSIFDKLIHQIEDVVTELNLHEYQENAIYTLVRGAEQDVDKLHSSLVKIEEGFANTVNSLVEQGAAQQVNSGNSNSVGEG